MKQRLSTSTREGVRRVFYCEVREREKGGCIYSKFVFEDLRLRTSLELVSREWHPDVVAASMAVSKVLLPVVVVVVAQARDEVRRTATGTVVIR